MSIHCTLMPILLGWLVSRGQFFMDFARLASLCVTFSRHSPTMMANFLELLRLVFRVPLYLDKRYAHRCGEKAIEFISKHWFVVLCFYISVV
uniref:Secreted protein n=1 Tax=Parascaris univalens TaxID=6257 RepID=A0A914ZSQ5_PARUN